MESTTQVPGLEQALAAERSRLTGLIKEAEAAEAALQRLKTSEAVKFMLPEAFAEATERRDSARRAVTTQGGVIDDVESQLRAARRGPLLQIAKEKGGRVADLQDRLAGICNEIEQEVAAAGTALPAKEIFGEVPTEVLDARLLVYNAAVRLRHVLARRGHHLVV